MNNIETVNNLEQLTGVLTGPGTSKPISMLSTVMTETLGMSMHNAVSTQHNAQQVNNAAITTACARILATNGPMPTPKPSAKKEEQGKGKKDEKKNLSDIYPG